MQRTSDAVQAHVQLNISIAREVSGHPGCQNLVKDKVLLAWCEGMLAERARMIASSCGLRQFPPFLQALQSLAADPCLPLPPLAGPNASASIATAAPPQLHRAQHSSLTLTARQIVSPRSNADLHQGGQPVPPRGMGASLAPNELPQGLVRTCPLTAMSLVQHSRQSMSEQRPEHGGPLFAAASIGTAQPQVIAAGPSGLQHEIRAARLGPHEAQGLQQRLISSGTDSGELILRGPEASQVAAAMSAGRQLGAGCNSQHEVRLVQVMPKRAHDVALPNDADTATTPATTAGVLQSGSSEELANALAGLTQMVSTARGMPRPGHQRQEPFSRDAPAASQQTPASQNRAPQLHIENRRGGVFNDGPRDERLSTGLCTLDVGPCMEHPMAGSQSAELVSDMDQNVAGSAQVDEASLSRPPKRARLAPEAELLHNLPQTGVNLPGGHISESAQPVTGLHPSGTVRSCASYVSQPQQQQPAGARAAPEPIAVGGGPGSLSDGANAIRAVISEEGPAAASLRLQVLEHKGGQSQPIEEQETAAAAGQPGDADAGGSLSAGAISDRNKELRAILRGDAAPSTSTEKSSPQSHQRSVHGAQLSCPEPSPTKDSAQHRASFAFAQPEGGRLRGALEQLTPALPARAACSAAPEAQPAARRGGSGDVVPDSEEHTTPPDQHDRGSQPRGSAPALECSAQPSFKMTDFGTVDGSHPQGPPREHEVEGAAAGGCRAALTGAADHAMGGSPLSTPRGTQLGASGGPGICPGSAERERLLSQAAGMPAAAAAALLESQRGSNSPNKRKLPQPRRPQDCGTGSGSGSPASQAPSSHSRGSSGKDGLAALAAGCSQKGASSQPSPLCPTRLGQHRLADVSSQPDAPPVGIPDLPQSQAAYDGVPAATGTAFCGSQPRAEAVEGHAGKVPAQTETAVRLKWLRAVRALHMIACRWQVPPAQQTWSSDVRVPISRDSSADASDHRPSGASHNSGSRSEDASAPHQMSGHAVVSPVGFCRAGEPAADAVPGESHSADLASSDWRTARSHGSGAVSHAGERSLQGRCSGGSAQVIEKRRREVPMDGEGSQLQPSAERACSHDDSAGQLAADISHQKKRQRTGEGWSAGGSQRVAPFGQKALMHQALGTQPAGAMDAQEEARARIGAAQQVDLHGSAPVAMEADSDVDIGGPDDLGQPFSSGNSAPGDHPLTQFPPLSASTHAPSQAAGTQTGLMHSSEEQDPPCGQPVPPPHLSLGDRAEDYGRTPAALLLKRPMERSPWATPHFSHPHTAERSHPDAPCSQRPAANEPVAGPSAAGASGQNATMRVLSLEGRPSPGWTPGLMCSGTGAATAMPQRGDTGGTVPDALHRLARRAPFLDPTGGLSLQQGSCQAPLMTQSERPDHPEAGPRQQLDGLGMHGLQGLGESQHFETCGSLDGLLYGASQNSDRSLPLSQPAHPLP
ncbi:hypothetical protein COCOBI_08-5500 [Coccomyxa sp. Obi]|nr:hypothetical protein COCOBI_08-5500 [Coccomyxa sp. Obi]